MYLFSRAVNLHGSPRKTLPWVQGITDLVNANSPLDLSVWNADFGQPIGTVVWNATVESQAALAAATGPLLGHDGYLDHLEAGQEFITVPGEDTLRSLVYGSPSDPPPVGSVATVTTAQIVIDRVADAATWSVEAAQYVEKVMGSSMSLWANAYGPMGTMTWIAVVADVAAADAASAVNEDAGYLDRLQASAGLFIEGSGEQARFTRII